MVVGLHRRAVADQRAEHAVGTDLDVVLGEDSGHDLVLVVADDLRQVLDEVAAEGDVQDLAAAADGEQGHVALECRREQCQLARVPLRADAVRLRVRLGAVALRAEVRATREEQSVESVERLVDPVFGGRD